MGNESSTLVDDDVPPCTLESRTLDALAKHIKSGKVKKIVVMTGAGISTSAGIPDFRSPGNGLYANLARLNLPFAEAVFDISYFRQNPLPFYTLAHELYPGRYRPTITHSFIALLHRKGLLLKLFTQNIDCLEREAGVPADKIVEAHGSFATQRCIECKTEFPDKMMKEHIAQKSVPHCPSCNGLVKPDIVFFGEALPEAFHRNRTLPAEGDLAIVMGTSLMVQPFASLPSFVTEQTPRLLINFEKVGGLGSRADDVLLLGDCDEGVRKLADVLGWREELEELWATTASEEDKAQAKQGSSPTRTKDEKVEDEVEKLTRDIEKTLKMSQDHNDFVKQTLEEDLYKQSGTSAAIRTEEKEVEQKAKDTEANTNSADTEKLQIPDPVSTTTQNTGKENNKSLGQNESDLHHVFPHIEQEKGEGGKSSL